MENPLKVIDVILNGLRPSIDEVEEKKLEDKDMQKRGEYWQKCYGCGCYFRAKNWHTPSDCPHCNRSRVD